LLKLKKPARLFVYKLTKHGRRPEEELTQDATSPEDADLGKFESAVAIGKQGLPAVRARSLHLEEGPGDAVGAAVAAAPAKGAGHQPVRPVPDGTGGVRVAGRGGYLG